MKYIHAFFMSLGMFSAIPCPYRVWDEKARRLMLVFLPLVGLVIGLIWYGLYLLTQKADVPLQLQAAALMLYPYLITGFIHLDGFMDTSDALLSRRTLEEKLRILKDPHTGAFAVISVAVLFIICYAAVTAVVEKVSIENAPAAPEGAMLALIFIPVITRCCSSITVLAGKPLAHSQYKTEEGVKKPAAEIAAIAIIGLAAVFAAIAAAAGSAASGAEALQSAAVYTVSMVLAVTLASYLAAIVSAARQLKGVSGDLAGYALTVGEGVAVVMLALLL